MGVFTGPAWAHSKGGKTSSANMTPEERVERGRRAGRASVAAKRANAARRAAAESKKSRGQK